MEYTTEAEIFSRKHSFTEILMKKALQSSTSKVDKLASYENLNEIFCEKSARRNFTHLQSQKILIGSLS